MASGKRGKRGQAHGKQSRKPPRPARTGSPRKPPGSQAATGGGRYGTAADLDDIQMGAPTVMRLGGREGSKPLALGTGTGPHPSWPHGLPESLRGMDPDDQVSIIIQDGGEEKPSGATELLGVLNVEATTDNGNVIPAGSKVWLSSADPASVTAAAGSGPRATVMRFGDLEGGRLPIRERTDTERIQAVEDVVARPTGKLVASANPTEATPYQRRIPLAAQQRGLTGDDGVLTRLEHARPGLAERLAEGLSPDELAEVTPQIAAAMGQAGAREGTYSFGGQNPGGPSLTITPDLDAVPPGSADLVIEDLDPGMDDEGRVLVGSEQQVRAYHEKVRALDTRVQRFAAGPGDPPSTQAGAEAIRLQTTWTADSVMDQLAWLIHHYRRPHADLADYLAFHIRDSQSQDARALQHYWPISLTGGPADTPEGRQLAQLLARGLGEADAYQVTTAMCRRMRDMFDASKDQIPLRLSEGELPAPAGFAWLDQPWLLRVGAGYWLPTRAVSWDTDRRPVRDEETGLTRWADCIRITQWLLIADDVAFRRWGDDRARADWVASRIGRLIPYQVELLPFDTELRISPKYRDQAVTSLGLLHILWMHLGMELPRSRPVLPSAPAVRKRVNRTLKHKQVHVITLRKIAYIGDPMPHFPRKIDWACRWWVDRFCRHIDPYTDEDSDGRQRKHKATPAGRSGLVLDDDHDICGVCLANGQTVRIAEVSGFFKGPTDKPIRTPARDRTLHRLSR